jgi:hypothetical protein
VQRVDGFFQPHHGRPEVAPNGHRNALLGLRGQRLDERRGLLDRVEPLQLGQAELQRQRAQLVAAGTVLYDEADLQKTDEVRVRLANGNACRLAQVAQRHGRHMAPEGHQQLRSDLDRLNATSWLFHGAPSVGNESGGEYSHQGFY